MVCSNCPMIYTQELRFIFPALPLLTMVGGVGLDAILPVDSSTLWYPLNMLHQDPHTRKMKKLDRQRLLTIGYYTLYRHSLRYALCSLLCCCCCCSIRWLYSRCVEYVLSQKHLAKYFIHCRLSLTVTAVVREYNTAWLCWPAWEP